jgi:hypothetical protein
MTIFYFRKVAYTIYDVYLLVEWNDFTSKGLLKSSMMLIPLLGAKSCGCGQCFGYFESTFYLHLQSRTEMGEYMFMY